MDFAIPSDLQCGPDPSEVRRSLHALIYPGATFEVVSLSPEQKPRVWVGDDIERATQNAIGQPLGTTAVYYLGNPLPAGHTSYAKNRDVLERRRILLDCDPKKPNPEWSATVWEKAEACRLADRVTAFLRSSGWPDPIRVDSGNGYQLVYACDLPNNDLSHAWVTAILRHTAKECDTDLAHVDIACHNACRLARLPGTWNRHGESTEERPHRMSHLENVPEPLTEVPLEALGAIAGVRVGCSVTPGVGTLPGASLALPDDSNLMGPVILDPGEPMTVPMVMPRGNRDPGMWFKKALAGKVGGISLATAGTCHDAIRKAAFYLAGHVHHGYLTIEAVRQALRSVCEQRGFDLKNANDAIEWGLENGLQKPLPWPDTLEPPAGYQRQGDPSTDPETTARQPGEDPVEINTGGALKTGQITTRITLPGQVVPRTVLGPPVEWACDILPRKTSYLWPGRIPYGKMTVFAGVGGVGKTFALLDIAATLSTGGEWPFSKGECAPKGSTLYISGEDDPDDTLVPRLIAMGADLSKIAFMAPSLLKDFSLGALQILSVCVNYMKDVKLVVIDPPTSYLAGVNDNNNSELRGLLTPLMTWSREHKVALLMNTHVNKGGSAGLEAASRVISSVAWVNAVRAAYMFVRSHDNADHVYFAPIKINCAKRPSALVYQISGKDEDQGVVEWIREEDMTADDVLNKPKKKSRGVGAIEWLIKKFNEKRDWPSNELFSDAAQDGVSRNALMSEEVKSLPIKKTKITGPDGKDYWTWRAKDGWPPLA